ncbi:DUF4365 domain-containing protein [Azospirillum lipoferum]|nr:DUF4365 domain-containing protein [Azospirillum lipoferum]
MEIVTTKDSDIQERLSYAYLTAVAARAGCQVLSLPVDRNGLDFWVSPIQGSGTARLAVQAKATTRLARIGAGKMLSFQLDRRTYDLLRRDATCPMLLVVLDMPVERESWLSVTEDGLFLRRAAFWKDMRGAPAIVTDSVAVHFSPENIFDHHAILNILEQSDRDSRKGA